MFGKTWACLALLFWTININRPVRNLNTSIPNSVRVNHPLLAPALDISIKGSLRKLSTDVSLGNIFLLQCQSSARQKDIVCFSTHFNSPCCMAVTMHAITMHEPAAWAYRTSKGTVAVVTLMFPVFLNEFNKRPWAAKHERYHIPGILCRA